MKYHWIFLSISDKYAPMLSYKKAILVLMLVIGLAAVPPIYHYAAGNLTFDELPEDEKTDAIMVFTGSSDRLVTGYSLYLKRMADKLMITGTDFKRDSKNASVKALARKANKKSIYVDLLARNTIENAENGAKWAIENKVKSILLITSEGHMPRAYFELRQRLPKNIVIYTEEVPGEVEYSGMDSEGARLYCRLYETALNKSFCYETRELARNFGL